MTDIVGTFLDYAEHDRGWSADTIRRYRQVLRSLPGVESWDVEDADRWWHRNRELAPASRNNELFVLRSFYKWAGRWDHRADDPTRRIVPVKVERKQPRPISRQEFLTVLAECDRREAIDLRRAFCLGAYAGLRVHEAAQLDWSEIRHEQRRIIVRGKGAKERVVGYSPVLLDEILPDTGGNVVRPGKAYSADALQRACNRLMESVGVKLTYHALRKRWATLAIAKTGNVHAVAGAAGWASIETASTYAALSESSLDDIANAVVE